MEAPQKITNIGTGKQVQHPQAFTYHIREKYCSIKPQSSKVRSLPAKIQKAPTPKLSKNGKEKNQMMNNRRAPPISQQQFIEQQKHNVKPPHTINQIARQLNIGHTQNSQAGGDRGLRQTAQLTGSSRPLFRKSLLQHLPCKEASIQAYYQGIKEIIQSRPPKRAVTIATVIQDTSHHYPFKLQQKSPTPLLTRLQPTNGRGQAISQAHCLSQKKGPVRVKSEGNIKGYERTG